MAQIHTSLTVLLDRMNDADKDFRFMATNDLMGELQRENISWDDDSETKVTHQILSLLTDKNGEVQNLAVKCLGNLVGKIKDERRQIVIRTLCQMLKYHEESLRDIASIALKTVVTEIPKSRRILDIFNNDLTPNLLVAIKNKDDVNVQLESLDILTELIYRVGSQINLYHQNMQQELIKQLESERSAVRKRSMNALSYLLACCSDELYNTTIEQLFLALKGSAPTTLNEAEANSYTNSVQCSTSKTLLQCIATVTRSAGHRTDIGQLTQIMPVIKSFCHIHDDELREYCLQAFEAYVRRCPVNVKSFLSDIIDVCLTNISHDPNYNYDADDENGLDNAMDTDFPEDGDASESAEDYSDDDDLSWKVRRASAKCLEAVVQARKDMINDFFTNVAPVLISRFKEREETVKSDIIQTFVSLLKQTRSIVNDSRYIQAPMAVVRLTEMIPTIVNKSANLLREKSIKTRQIVFQMFTEIVNIVPNILSAHIAILIPGVLYSLADKNSTSNMKIDALIFIGQLIKTHEPTIFYPQIDVILPAVITAVGESFYKIAAEALALLSQLVCIIRPASANYQPMANYEIVMSQIYQKTLEKMGKTDVDVEIREQAINCMGQIVATFGDKMIEELPVALNMLHDKLELGSETNRLTCVKALIKIANSPLPIELDCIFPKTFTTLATFLRKNSRPLKISTLILIDKIVKRSPNWLNEDSAKSISAVILMDLPSLINESDLYVSQLALTTLTTIIKSHKNHALQIVLPEKVLLSEILQLVRSPLLQGSALVAMLQFFSTLVESSFPNIDHKTLLSKLVAPIYNGESIHKQAYNSTAKCISAISVSDKSRALMTVEQLINDSKKYHTNDNIYSLILLSTGEIGKIVDLGEVPSLVDVLLEALNSSSEDVKSAGSYALGCVAVGNIDRFLPVILHEIEARNKRQYLILHSLREVISAGNLKDLDNVWNLLMKHCECQEEGTRNVVSECLGKLTLLKPDVLLMRLIEHLKKDCTDKPLARSTIVASIKFIISDQPHDVDHLLQQCIGEFLNALQDTDINVRRVALITLNSAAHNKPSLILNLLPQVLPLLYRETLVKEELIRQVEMGPFKHEVDDGLDSRKAAFECMYTLLDTCQNYLDIFEFLTHVENGLRDHYDIKMLTYLMLNRLASLCPAAVLQRIDRLITPIEEVCRKKPKENAVKQEFEKQDELKRSALRAFDALKSIPNADRYPAVVKFYDEFIYHDKELSKLYNSIHRDSVVSDVDYATKMDTD